MSGMWFVSNIVLQILRLLFESRQNGCYKKYLLVIECVVTRVEPLCLFSCT